MNRSFPETRVWLVAGRVQGVGFRAAAQREAIDSALRGSVENLPDGRVRAVGVSDIETLDRFERWLAKGPPGARVDSVTTIEEGADYREEVAGFAIR